MLALLAAGAIAEPVSYGTFETFVGKPGVVVAAPHEGFDLHTSEVASAAATVWGAGLVVARGFRTTDYQINVNRPTEGVGLAARLETSTDRATKVFQGYLERVREASGGPLALLVEVHGNSRKENIGLVEVATTGIGRESALRLKRRLSEALTPIEVHVQPLDSLHYAAESTKASGSFSLAPVALQIELPLALRAPEATRATGEQLGRAIAGWAAEGL